MKFKKSILTLAVASILFVGCKEKSNETDLKETAVNTEVVAPKVKKEIAAANLQTTSFSIDGMTCAIGCAKTIQEDLTALDGVQDAKVDFDTEVVESAADGKSYTVSNVKS